MQKKRFQVSLDIVRCDGFVNMPATAQALYIQILSACDDEGFTSQIQLCKFLSHASDEDVKILEDRRFIYRLGDHKNVAVVKHWRMNTYLNEGKASQSDFAERSLVFMKPNGNYTLDPSEGKPLKSSKFGMSSESVRNENGMSSETLRNTSPADKRERSKEKIQSNPIQSKPNHNNPIQSNPLHTNPNNVCGFAQPTYEDDDDEPF